MAERSQLKRLADRAAKSLKTDEGFVQNSVSQRVWVQIISAVDAQVAGLQALRAQVSTLETLAKYEGVDLYGAVQNRNRAQKEVDVIHDQIAALQGQYEGIWAKYELALKAIDKALERQPAVTTAWVAQFGHQALDATPRFKFSQIYSRTKVAGQPDVINIHVNDFEDFITRLRTFRASLKTEHYDTVAGALQRQLADQMVALSPPGTIEGAPARSPA
jgi:hypothetical protein